MYLGEPGRLAVSRNSDCNPDPCWVVGGTVIAEDVMRCVRATFRFSESFAGTRRSVRRWEQEPIKKHGLDLCERVRPRC